MLYGLMISIHLIVCVLLILLVLIQSDKGGGLAGALGGMGGVNTVFGGRGTANLLTKSTTWFAAIFMVLCIILNIWVARISSEQVKTVLQKRAEKIQKMAPAAALPQGVADPSVQAPSVPQPQPAPQK